MLEHNEGGVPVSGHSPKRIANNPVPESNRGPMNVTGAGNVSYTHQTAPTPPSGGGSQPAIGQVASLDGLAPARESVNLDPQMPPADNQFPLPASRDNAPSYEDSLHPGKPYAD